jgi:hypothetical protein
MEYPKKNALTMKSRCSFQEAFVNGLSDFAVTCPQFEVDRRYQSWGKLWRYRIVLLVWFSIVPHFAFAQPEHFALLVTGSSGNDEFQDKFSKWSTQLIEILQKDLLFPRDHIYFLTEDPGHNSLFPELKATKVQLAKTLDILGTRLKKGDLLLIILLGHASFDGVDYKFNLVGPDISGTELRFWLERFSPQSLAIVAATPCSGILSRQLNLKNRMLITATKSEFENNSIIFPEFLIEALKGRNADRDKNLHVSFLETFLFSSQKTAAWYRERGLLATEHPTLEDTGSQTPASEISLSNSDGLQAAYCFLDYPIAEQHPISKTAVANSEFDSLDQQRRRTEELIRQLKNKKATLAEVEYSKQLETLLIQLAEIAQKIREVEKKK